MTDDVKPEGELTPELATGEQALVVDVEGFEGPLDLLLTLARQQKVDLAKISILALAAGCDIVLHCNGELAEMEAVASEAPALKGAAGQRAAAALAARTAPQAIDIAAARATFAEMLTGAQPADARGAW